MQKSKCTEQIFARHAFKSKQEEERRTLSDKKLKKEYFSQKKEQTKSSMKVNETQKQLWTNEVRKASHNWIKWETQTQAKHAVQMKVAVQTRTTPSDVEVWEANKDPGLDQQAGIKKDTEDSETIPCCFPRVRKASSN